MKELKLYKISWDYTGYDEYDSAIVVAYDKKDARDIHPTGKRLNDVPSHMMSWPTNPKDVVVEYIGIPKKNIKHGTVICASFNAA